MNDLIKYSHRSYDVAATESCITSAPRTMTSLEAMVHLSEVHFKLGCQLQDCSLERIRVKSSVLNRVDEDLYEADQGSYALRAVAALCAAWEWMNTSTPWRNSDFATKFTAILFGAISQHLLDKNVPHQRILSVLANIPTQSISDSLAILDMLVGDNLPAEEVLALLK